MGYMAQEMMFPPPAKYIRLKRTPTGDHWYEIDDDAGFPNPRRITDDEAHRFVSKFVIDRLWQ